MIGRRTIARVLVTGIIAALLGAGAAIWGYLNEPQAFFTAWLAAFYFWLSMPVGALALLLIWDLTGGAWEPVARVPLSAMAATMPLFVLLFLPIIAGTPELYSWARPEVAPQLHNRWYLNSDFFLIRAAIYFVIWNGFMAWRLLRPATVTGAPPPGLAWISAIGVMLMGYAASLAAIDWLMSTEPQWFSSIYGMIVGSGQFIASLAFALLLVALAAPAKGSAARLPYGSALASLATILLAVVIFWAYTSFCQFLIVWEENLRTEIGWYIERWRGAWGAAIYALVCAHFLVPFVALVWTPAKRSPSVVGGICLLLLIADLIHLWWLLLPPFWGSGFTWLHPLIALGMGGLWLVVLSLLLRRRIRVAVPRRRTVGQAIHG